MENNLLKEIKEQPEALKKIIEERIKDDGVLINELEAKKDKLEKIERFLFLGSGSSSNAAIFGNYVFEEILGMPSEFEQSDEFIARNKVIEPNTCVVALSQSGETGDLLKAVAQAKIASAFVVGVTNSVDSSLGKEGDAVIDTMAGEENAIAATKSVSTQLLTLILIALWFNDLKKKEYADKVKLIEDLKNIPSLVSRVLEASEQMQGLVKSLANISNIFVLGRKYNYPIALEGAQKLKEVTYVHAEGFAAEEFRHGPKAMIDEDTRVIFIAPHDSTWPDNEKEIKELEKIGAEIIVIASETGESKLSEMIIPILSLVPFQLIAYHLALEKGIDTEKLRNIEKFIK